MNMEYWPGPTDHELEDIEPRFKLRPDSDPGPGVKLGKSLDSAVILSSLEALDWSGVLAADFIETLVLILADPTAELSSSYDHVSEVMTLRFRSPYQEAWFKHAVRTGKVTACSARAIPAEPATSIYDRSRYGSAVPF